MLKKVYTNIKFQKHSKTDKIVAFVAKNGKVWRGVSEFDECKKIIVLPDTNLAKMIELGVVYKCCLNPMANSFGFVAISATPLTYKARIEVEMRPRTYIIHIRYGNKQLLYSPGGREPFINDYQKAVERIKAEKRILNMGEILDMFREMVTINDAQYL